MGEHISDANTRLLSYLKRKEARALDRTSQSRIIALFELLKKSFLTWKMIYSHITNELTI